MEAGANAMVRLGRSAKTDSGADSEESAPLVE
jgi:hypothetical protein